MKNSTNYLRADWPEELSQPETGWPWLFKNRPWLFARIQIKSEPYAIYLESEQESQKVCFYGPCSKLVTGVTAKYCSKACKQAAYRDRKQ